MNADEIVKALRSYASDCGDDDACSQCTFAWMCEKLDGNAPKIIADLIERLNDFEHSQCAVLLARIAELEAQLAASQHREQAAVHDIMCRDHCDVCVSGKERDNECKNADYDCQTCKSETCTCRECRDEDHWQWRGPHEAGKGDSHGA